jgi:glutamate-1-semialdehyde 2,1-aminomutase
MDLWQRAKEIIPGGVSAPSRDFHLVDSPPVLAAEGDGAYLFGSDGKKYIDYYQSQGSLILGHANAAVSEAIAKAAKAGTSFSLTTEAEVEFAEEIRSRVPGVERVRFVTTGSDATSVAVRIARSATGRKKIVRFSGGYHGNADVMLPSLESAHVTPSSSGLENPHDDVYAPYNEVPEIDGSVAAVIVEPIACNMGLVAPRDGFLKDLREAASKVGAVLVFDEVLTGFRVGRGGASELFGIQPDLWCYGKVMGGGLPLAAVAGTEVLMNELSPLGNVYSAGTMAANPIAVAAGLATLKQLDGSGYEMLSGRASEFAANLRKVSETENAEVQVPQISSLLGMFFSSQPIANEQDAQTSASNGRYVKFFQAMLRRGVLLPPTPYSPLYLTLAHSWEDIDWTTDIASAAMAEAL